MRMHSGKLRQRPSLVYLSSKKEIDSISVHVAWVSFDDDESLREPLDAISKEPQ